MERCIAAFSSRSTERGQKYSFEDVYSRISENGAKPLLIVFSSDFDNFMLYSDLFKEKFPETQVIGTTSFFNYSSEGGAENGLSALAVFEGIECAGGVLEDADKFPIKSIGEAKKALTVLGINDDDKGSVCCLEFTTAFGRCEELVLDTLREAVGELPIPVVGSTSGTRKGTPRSYVSFNGKVYSNAGAFMFIRNTKGRIRILRENSYKHTEHFFLVTNVDCEKRVAYEFNGRPAAVYLASLLETEIPVLARDLSVHPIGRIYNDNIYIADGESVGKDASVMFYAHIYNYSRAVLLEPDDANAVTKRLFDKLADEEFRPSFSLAINCAFDYDIFADKGFTEKMISLLKEKAGCYTGVSGCGEQTDYYHVNKTLLLAVFE